MTQPTDPKSKQTPPPQRRPPTIPYAGPHKAIAEGDLPHPSTPPPPVPRPLTPAAKRRGIFEPKVRFWWLATIAMIAVAGWFLFDQIKAYRTEVRLIQSGTPVDAKIESVNAGNGPVHEGRPGSLCVLSFTLNGHPYRVTNVILTSKNDQDFIISGTKVAIKVDPNDPAVWTDKTTPEPLARRMIAATVILPVLLLALIFAWYSRRKVLQTWRDGVCDACIVHDVKQSALAPLSQQVRCADAEGRDKRLITVYVPNNRAKLKPGDTIWVIHPRGSKSPALAAMVFE